MRFLSTGLAALLIAAFAAPADAQSVVKELRDSLFETANQSVRKANQAQAYLLAPISYGEGAEYYGRAEDTLESGGNIDSIRRDLERARVAFNKSAEHSVVARPAFEGVLQARADAVSADAENYAPEAWQSAELAFADAAERLERGRLKSAQREGVEAAGLFRNAELAAIKANYLNETRTLLARAEEARADRYAPKSYAAATHQLKEAETALNTDRYDTDRPRSLAQQAKHNALHAIYVAGLESRIRRDERTLEDILLEWEDSIRELAALVDTPVHFDNGEDEAVSAIAARVTELQSELRRLTGDLADREAQILALQGEAETAERLGALVATQQRQRERFAKVESLFNESEANVLRQGEDVIIRMVGLNFLSGQATLLPEHYGLLSKLRSAIAEYPDSRIVIEGHTDSFGSDETNLALSQRRADAVQQYLLANAPVSPDNLIAIGYGEARPVSNNETPQGRTRNRRIDVVIYPESSE